MASVQRLPGCPGASTSRFARSPRASGYGSRHAFRGARALDVVTARPDWIDAKRATPVSVFISSICPQQGSLAGMAVVFTFYWPDSEWWEGQRLHGSG